MGGKERLVEKVGVFLEVGDILQSPRDERHLIKSGDIGGSCHCGFDVFISEFSLRRQFEVL